MQIKITGKSKELFAHNLTSILNTVCIVAMGGYIPNQLEIETPEQRGRYWFRENEHGANRFQLYPMSNDYWANVRDEGENFITLEFKYRYDRGSDAFSQALIPLLALRFRDAVTIIS